MLFITAILHIIFRQSAVVKIIFCFWFLKSLINAKKTILNIDVVANKILFQTVGFINILLLGLLYISHEWIYSSTYTIPLGNSCSKEIIWKF
jgi:hypothetical protein